MKTHWERTSHREPAVETGTITCFIRNGSDLPVDVVQVTFDINTTWWVRDMA